MSVPPHSPFVVVTGGDDAFAMGLAALGSSVIRHRPKGRPLDLYVVDAGLSPSTRDRLAASWQGEDVRVHWLTLTPETFEKAGLPVPASAPGKWTSLLLDHLMPAEVTRLLLLDADTLVLADLTPFWDVDLEGRAAAAVADTMIPHIQSDSYVPDGIDRSRPLPYFNAGALLIDLDHWKREGLIQKARDLRVRHATRLWGTDQQVLNWTLIDRWKAVPLAWNRMTHVLDIPSYRCTCVDRQDFEDALTRPKIAHFAGPSKPWHAGCRDDQTAAFVEEMQHTAWAPWQPPPQRIADIVATALWRSPHRRYQFIRRGLRMAEKERRPKGPWFGAAVGIALSRPWSVATFGFALAMRRIRRG